MTSKKTVEEFFAQPALAVVGVSRTGKKFGNSAYKTLKEKGYNVYQIHPKSKSIDGDECYPDFKSVPAKVGAAIMVIKPIHALQVLQEAADAGIRVIVAITEGIPVLDMMKVMNYLAGKPSRLIGPNCPGIITPGEAKIGIMPAPIHKPGGPIGVISRSGTITYEVVNQLTLNDIGQTTCIGIGGDPIIGSNFIDCLEAFENDPDTKGVVMVGEIGGTAEEEASEFVSSKMSKPVVGFVSGLTAPPGRRMGHAGAIISGKSGTAQGKIEAMKSAGIHICENLGTLGELCEQVFG